LNLRPVDLDLNLDLRPKDMDLDLYLQPMDLDLDLYLDLEEEDSDLDLDLPPWDLTTSLIALLFIVRMLRYTLFWFGGRDVTGAAETEIFQFGVRGQGLKL